MSTPPTEQQLSDAIGMVHRLRACAARIEAEMNYSQYEAVLRDCTDLVQRAVSLSNYVEEVFSAQEN